MICAAEHPQAVALAEIGLTLACSVGAHADGRHHWCVVDNDPPRPVRVHTVVTMQPEDWRFNVQHNLHMLPEPPTQRQSFARSIERLAETGDLLGVPVGIVVRTYTEGGPDAA